MVRITILAIVLLIAAVWLATAFPGKTGARTNERDRRDTTGSGSSGEDAIHRLEDALLRRKDTLFGEREQD